MLAQLGYDEKKLREHLSLPLAWNRYVKELVTDDELRGYWSKHHQEFDGSQVGAAHILIKLDRKADEATVGQAKSTLEKLREEITSGKVTFKEAAEKHSQAPSAKEGGDIGYFPYRGKMPVVFSKHAFPLEKGAVSPPFRTPFGLHLITVTEHKPGELSLEDVRAEVRQQRGQEIWAEIVAKLRSEAKIESIDKK